MPSNTVEQRPTASLSTVEQRSTPLEDTVRQRSTSHSGHDATPSEARARKEPQADTASDVSKYSGSDRPSTDWLTTGEAYQEAVVRGLTLTPGSFSNAVATWRKTGKMPKSLKALGMQENFEPYKAHPLAKTNRWLRFE